jgi:hypothetical protein
MAYTLRQQIRRLATAIVALAAIILLARLLAPELVALIPGAPALERTTVGGSIAQLIDAIRISLFGQQRPLLAVAALLTSMVTFVYTNIKIPQLLAASLGAGILAAFNGVSHLVTNRRIQKMCSAQLYVTAIKLVTNRMDVEKAFRVSDTGKNQKVILHVDNDVRAAMHRLRSELELIQDFSIAYDYAFWRRLRETSATLRMAAMSMREAIDVVMTEIDRLPDEADIDMSQQRYFALVVQSGHDGMSLLPFTIGVDKVITRALVLAEKLELGWFFQHFEGSIATLPTGLKSIRALVKQWLAQARKNLKRDGAVVWSAESVPWVNAATGSDTLKRLGA